MYISRVWVYHVRQIQTVLILYSHTVPVLSVYVMLGICIALLLSRVYDSNSVSKITVSG